MMKRLSNDIQLDSLVTLYLTLIEPYFRYCNTVWGNCEQGLLNKLQTPQNRTARIEKVRVVTCETVSGLRNTCSHVQSRQ